MSDRMKRVAADRNLEWDGCFNVRDLGGLRTTTGRTTRRGTIVRSDNLEHLTPAGWSAAEAYGIRTVVDLRNDDEIGTHVATRPAGLTIVRVSVDDVADTRFWKHVQDNELDGTPLYYRAFLDRKPERCAAVMSAIAHARPGGVVFHCGGGRDRTGLITLLLLALVQVTPEDVVSDYEISNVRLPPYWIARGEDDQRPLIEDILRRKETSVRALLLDLLTSLDAEAYLRSAGLAEDDLDALRARLLEPEISRPG